MRFRGKIQVGDEEKPIEFEIGPARPSVKAPIERTVTTSFPRSIKTTVFGVSDENALESAKAFLRGLIGDAQLRTESGELVDIIPLDSGSARVGAIRAPTGAGGLVLSLIPVDDRTLRLVVEQVHRTDDAWVVECLSTHNDYDRGLLTTMSLSPEQYGEIGFNVILSLLARAGLLKALRTPE